jgi:hypothetical protein
MSQPYPRTLERVAEWAADPDVLGVVWVGSRSRGYGDRYADDDLDVLLTPEAHAKVDPAASFVMEREPASDPPRLVFDAYLTSLAALEAKAASTRDLDHWPYERAAVLFARDGRVAAAVAAAAAMPPAFRRARIQHGALDAVLAIARAKKAAWRELPAAHAMLVARGAKALVRVVFALEGRWAPLDHWLDPELGSLADAAGAVPALLDAIVAGRHEALQEALTRLQPALEAEGCPEATGYGAFQARLIHPDRAAERAVHGLD